MVKRALLLFQQIEKGGYTKMETNNGQKHISPSADLLLLKEKQAESDNNGDTDARLARPKSDISMPTPSDKVEYSFFS